MPVPVSVTHKKGAGLPSHNLQELHTAGPFARLGGTTESADTVDGSSKAAGGNASEKTNLPSASGSEQGGSVMALETKNLNFWYPDIGKFAFYQHITLLSIPLHTYSLQSYPPSPLPILPSSFHRTDGRPMSGTSAVVQNMSVSLPRGATCLLIGPNGAGKTTLLKVLAGKHMVPRESVSVLGEPPFYATQLTASGALSYIGGNWERDIAFAGYSIPLAGDIPASQMLSSLPGIDPVRRERLIEALDIDPTWRMHLVSDGQRRRVQIAMGLLRPFELLLLDEVTVDLDVLGRADLMAFLKQECEERGATVVYATHIFDGLEAWPSHLMYVAGGQLKAYDSTATAFPELKEGTLLELVEGWLRVEKEERLASKMEIDGDKNKNNNGDNPLDDKGSAMDMPGWSNGYSAGRLTSSMKLSSNAVMRM